MRIPPHLNENNEEINYFSTIENFINRCPSFLSETMFDWMKEKTEPNFADAFDFVEFMNHFNVTPDLVQKLAEFSDLCLNGLTKGNEIIAAAETCGRLFFQLSTSWYLDFLNLTAEEFKQIFDIKMAASSRRQ